MAAAQAATAAQGLLAVPREAGALLALSPSECGDLLVEVGRALRRLAERFPAETADQLHAAARNADDAARGQALIPVG